MQNRKVAVINDDKNFLGDVGRILSMSGYSPILVDDEFLAADSIIRHSPDAILMDLRILRRSGCEVANVFNRVLETSRVPIIAMSEFVKDEFSELLNFFGIKSYLRKPFQPLDVIWAVENEIREGKRLKEVISMEAVSGNIR